MPPRNFLQKLFLGWRLNPGYCSKSKWRIFIAWLVVAKLVVAGMIVKYWICQKNQWVVYNLFCSVIKFEALSKIDSMSNHFIFSQIINSSSKGTFENSWKGYYLKEEKNWSRYFNKYLKSALEILIVYYNRCYLLFSLT